MTAMRAKAVAWMAGAMVIAGAAALTLNRAPARQVDTAARVAEAAPAPLHIAWNKGERYV